MGDLRKQLLDVCHKFEDKEFMAVHGKCDMELAAPRCAKRVKAIESIVTAQLADQKQRLLEAIPKKVEITELSGDSRFDQQVLSNVEGFNSAIDQFREKIKGEEV